MKLIDLYSGRAVEVLMSTRDSTGHPVWRPGRVVLRDFLRNSVKIEFQDGVVYQITLVCENRNMEFPRIRPESTVD